MSELGYVHGVSTERTYKSDRRIGSNSALSVVMAGIVIKCAIEMMWMMLRQSHRRRTRRRCDGVYIACYLHLSIG